MDQGTADAGAPSRRDEYWKVLGALIQAAMNRNGFETICTMLRVGGMADANWDPFEESRSAFDDYNWALEALSRERGDTAVRRQRLLMYCQAVEMSAPHEMLSNLLRVVARQRYVFDPFQELWRPAKKGKPAVPPSAKTKLRRIEEQARAVGQTALADAIRRFFDDRVRNAFSHSDYVLTPEHFRFSEGRTAAQLPIAQLDRLTDECFAFYGAFLATHRAWLKQMSGAKKLHKMPQFEVLELLSSPELGLYGFHLHFSTGSKATYSRRPEGTKAVNLNFERDGGLTFMIGDLGKREPVWKVNGKAVLDWSAAPASDDSE